MAKILIADDMLTISVLFENLLEDNGFDVVGRVNNCCKALDFYEKTKPDILILDLFGMNSYSSKFKKEINSFDVISELYTKFNAKIIVVTSSFREQHIKKALDMGAKDYFIKGEPLNNFIEKVNKILK